MYEFAVHVYIRKGLGPGSFEKIFYFGYDDVPQDVEVWQMKQWAHNDAEKELMSSEDYRLYGRNWTIGDIILT